MRDYPTLQLDANSSKGTLFFLIVALHFRVLLNIDVMILNPLPSHLSFVGENTGGSG